jgi:hypothetical protein
MLRNNQYSYSYGFAENLVCLLILLPFLSAWTFSVKRLQRALRVEFYFMIFMGEIDAVYQELNLQPQNM